ncbi:Thr/Ser protein kinase [Pyrolobus fumarii 1A]|uniref:Thr/Ser protein kinase n=1 Tax=Pyrolobus fumarii (strain DSM 11204 / 1A) TaxID=694429 RepID=G0EEZ0_PYRF1|nr:Thr/Ser protein kinase [Pyrolobus fumarii]AEM38104.1 Thr/Ser protein kinase [Pyrolobus fumarii 1A]
MECLRIEEARRAICYPRPEAPLCDALIDELRSIGVECIVPMGRFRKAGIPILGSGWAGNVFAALWNAHLVAIKALKPNSRRKSMLREALLAKIASMYGVAPRVYTFTRRLIVMKLVNGSVLASYKPSDTARALLVLRRLLYKAYILDRLGIDHGELVRPGGQVMVEDDEPYIIDFDSASALRKPRNVTSLAAGLARIPWASRLVKPSSDPSVRTVLREYRRNPTLNNFEAVLDALGL